MAFIGSISQPLRKFFATHARLLAGRQVYVGCSGNFTIEAILSSVCPSAELYSNDVSLYSTAVGYMLTDRQLALEIVHPELRWLNDYAQRGSAEQVAVLMLLAEALKFEKRNNRFKQRMWQAYEGQFPAMFEATLVKVCRFRDGVRIRDYTTADVFDYFPRPGAVSIGFLPTYVGGYERLFKALAVAVRWESPGYEILTTERRLATLEKMARGDYILYDDAERDLPCVAKVQQRGKRAVYIYSNLPFPGALLRQKSSERVRNFPILMPDDEIPADAVVTLLQVDLATVNHYRSLFLSKRIAPAPADLSFLVFAGGRLIGAMMFTAYSVKIKSPTEIYLMSDFVVPSRRHSRLAKLMLLVTLCRETREALERAQIKRYQTILTSVFTDKPVSMKYRGLYELAKRGEGFLNYRGTFGDMTLQEVIPAWKSRFDKP